MAVAAELIAKAHAVPIGEIADQRGIRLRGRIERVGPCPVCGGKDRFAINVRKGLFNCRGCGVGGDVIALVRFLDGVGFREACQILAGETVSNWRPPIVAKPTTDDAERYERQQRAKARTLFRRSVPAAGTLAETYLRSRGIVIPPAGTVRFLEATAGQHPAMLVPYGLADELEPGVLDIGPDNIAAVHLTLLKPDGSGKADVKPNKLTIGSPAGRPLVLAPMNDLLGLAITEGVEDALSVHQASGLGAWAAGSWPFMPKLVAAILELAGREEDASPESVTILADSDDGGRRGARELARALVDLGIEVLVEGLR